MTQEERVEAFKAFKKSNEDAKKKVQKIVDEVLGIMDNLYYKQKAGKAKVNVVDNLNIDLYYEHILHSKYSVAKMLLYIGDMEEDGTEEEFGFVYQRLNDLLETAKSNFEKIKHIISKIA